MADTKISGLATASTIVTSASTTLTVIVQGGTTKQTPVTAIIGQDYEEGTWTPTLIPAEGTITYTAQVGSYTKTGNSVNFHGRITISTVSALTAAGAAFTLPFVGITQTSLIQSITIGSHYKWATSSLTSICGRITTGAASMNILKNAPDEAISLLKDDDLTDGAVIVYGGSYLI